MLLLCLKRQKKKKRCPKYWESGILPIVFASCFLVCLQMNNFLCPVLLRILQHNHFSGYLASWLLAKSW